MGIVEDVLSMMPRHDTRGEWRRLGRCMGRSLFDAAFTNVEASTLIDWFAVRAGSTMGFDRICEMFGNSRRFAAGTLWALAVGMCGLEIESLDDARDVIDLDDDDEDLSEVCRAILRICDLVAAPTTLMWLKVDWPSEGDDKPSIGTPLEIFGCNTDHAKQVKSDLLRYEGLEDRFWFGLVEGLYEGQLIKEYRLWAKSEERKPPVRP